jgi:hypothetical protein
MLGNSWVAAQLAASQEVLSSMELVSLETLYDDVGSFSLPEGLQHCRGPRRSTSRIYSCPLPPTAAHCCGPLPLLPHDRPVRSKTSCLPGFKILFAYLLWGCLGRVGLSHRHKITYIRASSGIRTHDLSVRVVEDGRRVCSLSHCGLNLLIIRTWNILWHRRWWRLEPRNSAR